MHSQCPRASHRAIAAYQVITSAPEHGGFWHSVWWAVVTATTVGYGDITLQTLPGRITAVFLMPTGIGLVAALAAALASYFVGGVEKEQELEIQQLRGRLESSDD